MTVARKDSSLVASGFTLVELLVVIGVAISIAALATRPILSSLRTSAVRQAAADIIAAASEARALSQRSGAVDGVIHAYGVRMRDDGRRTTVEVIVQPLSSVSGSPQGQPALLDRGAGPVFQKRLSAAALVRIGSSSLSDHTPLSWWYTPVTGQTVSNPGLSGMEPTIGVGLRDVLLTQIWGLDCNSGLWSGLAPGDDSEPGLSVRSSDGRHIIAIGVYPSGVPFSQETRQ